MVARLRRVAGCCAVFALVGILLVAASTSLPAGDPDAASVPAMAPRALWIWEQDSFRLLDDAGFRDEMTDFFRQRRVSTLYLYADSYRGRNVLVNEPGLYRDFITVMHQRGFQVYALLGSYWLHTETYALPKNRRVALRMFTSVLRYNRDSDTAARFDGVNIDIEPYLLADWGTRKTLRATQYLDLSAEYMRLKRLYGDALAVGPAMPFWYDGIDSIAWQGRRKKLSEHVQDIYDYVAIMDYRNFAAGRDSILAHAANELDYAEVIRRPVMIGVETLNTEPRKVTFHGLGRAYMEGQLAQVENEWSARPSFAGFAIHHLGSYRAITDSDTG